MTGKEILEVTFEKSGMRGYRADQVDDFLKTVADFVDSQETENQNLLYKVKVLAQKIEEYKKDEESIRDALLSAQKLGASVRRDAEAKAEAMLKEAEQKQQELLAQSAAKVEAFEKESMQRVLRELEDAKKASEKERQLYESMHKEVSAFRATILKQYKAHLDLLANLPVAQKEAKPEPQKVQEEQPAPVEEVAPVAVEEPVPAEEPIEELSQEEEAAYEAEEMEQTREFSGNVPVLEEEPAEEKEIEEEPVVTPPVRTRPNYMEKFGELRFGNNSMDSDSSKK